MLKAIVVDDLKEYRDTILQVVQSSNYDIQIVAEAVCVKDAELQIKKHHPDIVFLDIEMPDGTAFDLLQKFSAITFKIIFITAYQDFSIKAFKYSAIDYILKPIDNEELHQAILRTKEVIDKESLSLKFSALLSNINAKNQRPQKLILKTAERIFAIDIDDIVRCQAETSYTQFFLIDGKKILVSKNMKEYIDLLPNNQFYRTHHAHLININYFDHFIKADGGTMVMKDHSKVPVSSRKKEELLKVIDSL